MHRATWRRRSGGHVDRYFTRGRTRRPVLVYTGPVDGGSDDVGRGGRTVSRRGEGDNKGGVGLAGSLNDGSDSFGRLFAGPGAFLTGSCPDPSGVEIFGLKGGRLGGSGRAGRDVDVDVVVGDGFPALRVRDLGIGVRKIRLRTDRAPEGNSTM
jgi:hypothetical protein